MNYRVLGKCGLRVSEVCLGTMTFGTEWGWGADKATSKQIFDAFVNAGGNFFDTANRYTNGTSEQWLGEFIKPDRHSHVVGTKYSLKDRVGDLNFSGNHRKNMNRSVEESLKRLDTDFIDILWLHSWDFTTSPEEVLRGMDDLVRSGKVLHLGISNAPAWVISQANTLADWKGLNKFVAIQVEYSLIQRAPERDLLPMAEELGISVTAWGGLGNGVLTAKYLDGQTGRLRENSPRFSERNIRIATELKVLSQELNVPPSQIALAWIMQQRSPVIPVLGIRNEGQLADNLGSLQIVLSEDTLNRLHNVSSIELGYPHDLLGSTGSHTDLYAGLYNNLSF
ncbi:aldo/keto reductase [Dyadobacter arcticus]|uniref:Aryl-alcohol dehydrogenase-like predicted oxidoreductase n=1 Tax=Dyadobacter arcticus TaxID=1078754 RepID=A0ABX0US41_9BACT|nr:aldo/keto reductase [Dyadobacter arcticus]NIJ53796.1 aryl-alcohol dehydrogenase-like predicted oxidoreductase [Dyadobacter arcticus]